MTSYKAIILVMLSFTQASVSYADAWRNKISSLENSYGITIAGQIKESDVIKVQGIVNKYRLDRDKYDSSDEFMKSIVQQPNLNFSLMSLGGDVRSAIKIGRMLRAAEGTVAVPSGETCASACVFIYAAGLLRLPYGDIVVHRPYSTSTSNRPISVITEEAEKINSLIHDYLKEMGVSVRLLDIMNSVSSKNSRTLPYEELQVLGLGSIAPVLEEKLDAIHAGELGLSRQEYYRMLPKCESFSYKSKQYYDCFDKYLSK